MLGLPYKTVTWMELLMKWLSITDTATRCIALLALQVFTYHIWRERNYRLHEGGLFNPDKLLDGILNDIKTRASSSSWFIKHAHGILTIWLS